MRDCATLQQRDLVRIDMSAMKINKCICFFMLGYLSVSCVDDNMCDGYAKGLTSVPSDIPTNVTLLTLYNNAISNFSADDFTFFYQLQNLDTGMNPFTQFPDLRPAGKTLIELRVKHCKIATIDSSVFNELRVIQRVNFSHCLLTSFPNVP